MYQEQLMGEYSLKDLQEEIFQNIPTLLDNLEADEASFNDDDVKAEEGYTVKVADKALKSVDITGFEHIKFLDENGHVISGSFVYCLLFLCTKGIVAL